MTGKPKPDRRDIITDVCGVNHFTFITRAKYRDVDLFSLLHEYIKTRPNGSEAYYKSKLKGDGADFFAYRGRVALDFFRRYGTLGAAGDRHLAEFVNGFIYLGSKENAENWGFSLTTVDYRIKRGEDQTMLQKTEAGEVSNGNTPPLQLKKSSEEAVEMIKAISGFGTLVSNVNLPNIGQMASMPPGSIIETNCAFSNDYVRPVAATEPCVALTSLIRRACDNIEALWDGIQSRSMSKIFMTFMNEPLCSGLSLEQGKNLFAEMVNNTKHHLTRYFNLDELKTL
jgi:alpha-galactosidase